MKLPAWLTKTFRKNGKQPITVDDVYAATILKPRGDDAFSLGAKAESLRNSEHWETVQTFCAMVAEQEILSATDNPSQAAACAHRAKALLGLTSEIDNAILQRQQLIRAQQERRAELEADDTSEAAAGMPPKTSQRWMARGAGRLA